MKKGLKEQLDQIMSIQGKNINVIVKTCDQCGIEYRAYSDDTSTKCLRCQVVNDMKLPENTIVNQNVIMAWKTGKYNNGNIDPIYLGVLEGVILLEGVSKRNHLSGFKSFGEKSNDEIDKFIHSLVKRSSKAFDAIVVLRLSPNGSLHVFGIRFSSKLAQELKGKDVLTIKNFCVSTVVKSVLKGIKK